MAWTWRIACASFLSWGASRGGEMAHLLRSAAREGSMARILLADDDAATRELVQRALAMDGHDVVVTQDGAEALERLEAGGGRIDLLISDVQMPGVDGIDLVEKGLVA